MSLGTGTPQIGSWVCRADEKLVVNVIWALYQPQTVDGISDIILVRNSRDSYLFAITDNNTLTREAFRARRYMPTQDLTDPTAGTLLPINTNPVVYKRVIASDADLIAP